MSTAASKSLVRAFVEAWNARDLDRFDDLMADSCRLTVGGATIGCSPTATRAIAEHWLAATGRSGQVRRAADALDAPVGLAEVIGQGRVRLANSTASPLELDGQSGDGRGARLPVVAPRGRTLLALQ